MSVGEVKILTHTSRMNEGEKKEVLQRLVTRVSTGLLFIEFDYLPRHENPDAAWIRNIYILISFYTELLLKAVYVINNDFKSLDDLDIQLRKLGHNLEKIASGFNRDNFGITSIRLKKDEYCIETDLGNFCAKDFNDIRYDFIDGKMRILNGDEHKLFKEQIEIMLKINGKLKPLAWN